MNEPAITIAGNLTADPELRYTTTGKAVALLRVASTPRRRDDSGQWVDGNTTYLDAEAWGGPGENAAESLHKGDRVLISGRIRTDVWTPDSGASAGQEQRRPRIVVDELGASLRHTAVRVARTARASSTPSADSDAAEPAQD